MKLSDLMVDSAAIEQGDWTTITGATPAIEAKGDLPPVPATAAFRVKVRGYGNGDYRRRQSQLTAALAAEFGLASTIPADRYEEIELDLLCETILCGWEGLTEDDGVTEIPFSPAKAKEILADPDARLLRGTVETAARAITVRRKKRAEDNAGNWQSGSSGI